MGGEYLPTFEILHISSLETLFHSVILTLNGPAQFSPSGCKAWIAWEFVFMELLTLAVESVLVMRGEPHSHLLLALR